MKIAKALICTLICSSLSAQTIPSNASNTWNNLPAGFMPGATIHVYIDSASAPPGSAEANAVQAGLDSAAKAYSYNGNTFQYSFVNGDQGAPKLGNNEYYVTDQSFPEPTKYGNNHAGSMVFNSVYGIDVVQNGTLFLDFAKLTSSEAEQFGSAHEISHDFYLGDCSSGCGQTSLMSYEINVNNPPFLGPQSSDIDYSFGYSSPWDQGPEPEW